MGMIDKQQHKKITKWWADMIFFFLPFDVLIRGKSNNSFTKYEAFHTQFSNGHKKQNFTSLVRKIQVWESGEINNKKINEWMEENRRSGTWRNDSSGKSNRLWGHQHTHTFRTAPTSAIFFDVTGPLLWELERCSRRCQVRHAQYYYFFYFIIILIPPSLGLETQRRDLLQQTTR